LLIFEKQTVKKIEYCYFFSLQFVIKEKSNLLILSFRGYYVKTIRRECDRSAIKLDGWDSRYTSSFGNDCDPKHMGLVRWRVINEDKLLPGKGFTYAYRNMEIISYVLDGV